MIDHYPPPTPSYSCAHLSELIALMDKRPGKTPPGKYPIEPIPTEDAEVIESDPKVYAISAKQRQRLHLKEKAEERERIRKLRPKNGGYFKVMTWTASERRRLERWRRDDPGIITLARESGYQAPPKKRSQ